ncbi:MAG: S8 family serine peptidase [Candidatus Aenigmarchaeota archaeon]|nr:S8 family serine peptidase [Candidatus Aenigmarchaeota archaeon]
MKWSSVKMFLLLTCLLLVLLNSCWYQKVYQLGQEIVDTSDDLRYDSSAEFKLDRENPFQSIRRDDDSIELAVGLENNRSHDLACLIQQNGGKVTDNITIANEIKAMVVDLPYGMMTKFKVEAQNLSRYIQPITKFCADFVPNDAYINFQWALEKIDAYSAWNITMGSKEVLVAIVDTGIDYNHPDLADNYVNLGYDWVNNDNDPMDDHGHGTHCAGIVAASLNNSLGVSGLAQVRIMAEKGLDYSGSGWDDDLAKAIIHAVEQRADIINLSWGSSEDSSLIHDAIEYAYSKGVLVVAAAGNDASDRKHYPAAYEEVIAVAATNKFDETARFTNFGEWVEIAAPGVEILSTCWDDYYKIFSGTSMSAPCIVGVAALTWSNFPWMTRDQIRTQLRITSEDLGEKGFDVKYGHGRINARKAVESIPPEHDILLMDWQRPRHIRMGDATIINGTILNFGMNDEKNVRVELLANSILVNFMVIDSVESGKCVKVSFSWMPRGEGKYNVTLYISKLDDAVQNNFLSAEISVSVPRTILVPRDYSRVQAAVEAAYPWDTIEVSVGTYYESIKIDKPLSLLGKNKERTIIYGLESSDVIAVSASNVKISGFTIRNGKRGIYLLDSSECILSGNIIMNNSEGILVKYSSFNVLKDNMMELNERDFGVEGSSISHFIQDMDTSNTINRKPVYYWIDQSDKKVPTDASQVILVCSRKIVVDGLSLFSTKQGILLVCTDDSRIENVYVASCEWGILLLGSMENKIQNNSIALTDNAIALKGSDDNTVRINEITKCAHGIKLWFSRDNSISENTLIKITQDGLFLGFSEHNHIHRNNLTENENGISLYCSTNILRDNKMINNSYSFGVYGSLIQNFIQDVDPSNTVDERPIHYLINRKGLTLDDKTLPNTGYLGIINSTGIKIKNLELKNNQQGILLAFTQNSTLENLKISDNRIGIELVNSSENLIRNNVLRNIELNIHLQSSSKNTIVDNKLMFKLFTTGIELKDSKYNVVMNNSVSESVVGIILYSCENNYFVENTLEANLVTLYLGGFLVGNLIYHNNFIGENIQIFILGISLNTWDKGYPSGGNYWSDYTGIDRYSGPSQNESGRDGIGDTPYKIDQLNQDRYPLMSRWVRKLKTDLNNDGEVNIIDIAIVAKAYGSKPGDPRWDPDADLDNNGIVNIIDVAKVAREFGKTA